MRSNTIAAKQFQYGPVYDNFRDIVLSFSYPLENGHLTRAEFEEVLEALDYHKISYFKYSTINRSKYINGYMETILRFPNIADWEKTEYKQKLFSSGKKYSNHIYYFVMVIIGRVNCDFNVLNSKVNVVNCLKKSDMEIINEILKKELGYELQSSYVAVLCFINKLILYYNKYLYELTDQDIYNYVEVSKKIMPGVKATFNIFKQLNIIDRNSIYYSPIKLDDIEKIKIALNELNYKDMILWKRVVAILSKIVRQTGKYIYELNENDVYNLIDNSEKKIGGIKATFFVLKYLGVINNNIAFRRTPDDGINRSKHLYSQVDLFIDSYHLYKDFISKTSFRETSKKLELEAREFLNWLWNEFGAEINDFSNLEFDIVADYVLWLKLKVNSKTDNVFSKHTINGKVSRLRQFFIFLYHNMKLDENWTSILFGIDAKYNDLYYDSTNKLPEPVPIEDRRMIEKIINNLDNKKHYKDKRMLKLLYLYGMRPSEMIVLKLSCIVGTKELPLMHIHRAKGFKERYIPLTHDGLVIIKEMQKINSNSPNVYSEFDGESCKRLFHDKGCLTSHISLNRIFKDLLVENGLTTVKGESKYSLYVLRQIRITTWLEAGISEYEVAELVGHGDVDSHNSYIVSKEKRSQNAKLVYDEFYADFFNQIVEKGKYIENKDDTEGNLDYVKKLQESLLRIESKTINRMVLEDVYKDFPEYSIPLPCGDCLAKVLYNFDFECIGMNFPCLECEELSVDEGQIKLFDEFVCKVYTNLHKREKAELNGLVDRSNALIDRLKIFYIRKFNFDGGEIELHFKVLKERATIKRGRKKNSKNKAFMG